MRRPTTARAGLSTLIAAALALGFVSPDPARAGEPPTDRAQGLSYVNLTVVRLNPLGLQNMFELDYWLRLYEPGDSQLLQNNFVSFGIAPIVTPASTRLGVTFKIRPLNVLKLEVKWEYLAFFGNFDLLQSYDSPNAEFSDTHIKDRGKLGENYSTDGWQLTLDGELRAKLGPIIIRNRFKAGLVDMALKGTDTVWYEQYYDLMLPKNGWFFVNDADVLVEIGPQLIVGVRHSMGLVDYPDDAFASVHPDDAARKTNSAPTHRLGPLIAWRFFDEPGAAFNQPTLLLLVQWYLQHRWRTGADVSQAFPYIVLGFAFSGDLL